MRTSCSITRYDAEGRLTLVGVRVGAIDLSGRDLNVRLHGATLHGLRGVELARVSSIDVGPDDAPEMLEGDAAVAWLRAASG